MSSSAITGSATVGTPQAMCKVCGPVDKVKTCSQCLIAKYCSSECQKKDRRAHKSECLAANASRSSSSSKVAEVAHDAGVSSSTSSSSSSSSTSPAKAAVVAGTVSSSTSSSSSSSSSSATDSSTSQMSYVAQCQKEIEELPKTDLYKLRTQHIKIVGHHDIIFVVTEVLNLDKLKKLVPQIQSSLDLDLALTGILFEWAENTPNVTPIRLIENHAFGLADALNKTKPSSILLVFVNNHSSASDDLIRLAQEAVTKRETARTLLPGSEHDPNWVDVLLDQK